MRKSILMLCDQALYSPGTLSAPGHPDLSWERVGSGPRCRGRSPRLPAGGHGACGRSRPQGAVRQGARTDTWRGGDRRCHGLGWRGTQSATQKHPAGPLRPLRLPPPPSPVRSLPGTRSQGTPASNFCRAPALGSLSLPPGMHRPAAPPPSAPLLPPGPLPAHPSRPSGPTFADRAPRARARAATAPAVSGADAQSTARGGRGIRSGDRGRC